MSRLPIFIVLTVFLLSSCQPSQTHKEMVDADSVVSVNDNSINKDSLSIVNQTARLIAGMTVDSSMPFYRHTLHPEWKAYSERAERVWKQFDSISQKYISFAKREFYPVADTFRTVFYPFSGPDFLFVNFFYPKADKIYMFGLEEPGSLPSLEKVPTDSIAPLLNIYKTAIEDVINISFFRTVDMKVELSNAHVDGTAPILMLFLVRSGKEVIAVNPVTLDQQGRFIPRNIKDKVENKAIEITYRNPGESKTRYIYYLSTNIADPSLKKNIPFYNFLKNLEPNIGGYIKSATYLMHKSYFSIVRNTVLNKTNVFLQDDSGIGFKYIKPEKWNTILYGSYSKPIPLFEEHFEQDLLDAFKTGNPKPLGFRIGYHPKSNLLLAIRKK